MDLNDLNLDAQAEAGAEMHLAHPVTDEKLMNDGKPMTLNLIGTESKQYRAKEHEFQNKRLNKISRGKKLNMSVNDDETCDLLSVCIVGWSGLVMGGEEIEFSQREAVKLLMKFKWIRDQVDEFVGDRTNFFTGA